MFLYFWVDESLRALNAYGINLDARKRTIEMRDSKRHNEIHDGFSVPFPCFFLHKFGVPLLYKYDVQSLLKAELLCC